MAGIPGMMDPLVTVCIANYNGAGVVEACIESVLTQDWRYPVEVLVHDDASTDGSATLIRARYPQVELIASPANVGFCMANNRMAEKARGKYLLLLNNDAALFPDALGKLMAEAERLGKAAILTLPQFDAETGALLDMGCRLDPFHNPVPNLDPSRHEVAMVIGACLWIPRTLWLELGGFPEWFESIGEDLYLCCHARLAGYAVRVLGVSGYHHHAGHSFGGGKVTQGGQLSTTWRRRALSERNKSFVMALTCPSPLVWLLLPIHLLVLALEGAALSLAKGSARPWNDIYAPVFTALWLRRWELAGLRKAIQASRALPSRMYFSVFTWVPYKLGMLIRHGLPEVR